MLVNTLNTKAISFGTNDAEKKVSEGIQHQAAASDSFSEALGLTEKVLFDTKLAYLSLMAGVTQVFKGDPEGALDKFIEARKIFTASRVDSPYRGPFDELTEAFIHNLEGIGKFQKQTGWYA